MKCILKGSGQCLGHSKCYYYYYAKQRNLENCLFRNNTALLYDSLILATNLRNEFKTFEGKP